MKNPHKNIYSRNLTLIELLVAVSLLTLVGMALFAVFSCGLRALVKAEAQPVSAGTTLLFLETMERDVRSAMTFEPLAFAGQGGGVGFPALVEDAVGEKSAWRPGFIRYRFDAEKRQLIREVFTFSQAVRKADGTGHKMILAGVDGVAFRYAGNYAAENPAWDIAWNSVDSFPEKIRVELTFGSGSEKRLLSRMISVPVGER
jgi:hypothetical protein